MHGQLKVKIKPTAVIICVRGNEEYISKSLRSIVISEFLRAVHQFCALLGC
jgi:hypothetical protein